MRLSARSHAARRHPLGSTLATVGLALVAVLNETPPAQAATFTVLHSFTGPDGANPYDGLISDPAGNLYGTTFNGGSGCLPYSTCGVIFELERGGNLTVLHAFSGSDGSNPSASLLRDSAGNLYGTTKYGGNNDGCAGCGVVFQLDTAGTETVLHQFAGYNTGGGALPDSSLIWDSALGLCSTAPVAGAYDEGVVFTLNPATGGFSVLYAFEGTGLDDGETPNAALIQDSAGNSLRHYNVWRRLMRLRRERLRNRFRRRFRGQRNRVAQVLRSGWCAPQRIVASIFGNQHVRDYLRWRTRVWRRLHAAPDRRGNRAV